MKKLALALALSLLLLCGCEGKKAPEKISVVTTVFPAYDFARAAAGDKAEVSMLLPPGTELHSFEPSAEDILKIKNADIFIYTGGESDSWIERVLSANGGGKKAIKMMACSTLIYHDQAHHEGELHSHEGGADEHVWLSPENAKSIVLEISAALGAADGENSAYYKACAERYCAEITRLDAETAAVIKNSPKSTIVVADRFPLKYFCHHYGLSHYAAFDACDLLADADAKTVLRLIDTVNREGLDTVFYIENGSGYLADTVCKETGAEKAVINSMHTVSREDFLGGVTYLDIMEQNKSALERGLY